MSLKQPFEKTEPILTASELIDTAFKAASNSTVPRSNVKIVWIRKKEIERIKIVKFTITSKTDRIINVTPWVHELHPFYRELVALLVGIDGLKKSLAAVNWAGQKIGSLATEYIRKISRSRTITEAGTSRKIAYGRIASVLQQVSDDLVFLRDAFVQLRKLPSINPTLTTIVIAGYANVGKSTLVRSLSTAKPEVATYPFTTKGIVVGHRTIPKGAYQIVDTPGMLDRPLSKRNKIELQAIGAIKHLADVIIFMVDASETCGYDLDKQTNLLSEIINLFPNVPIVRILNKVDVATRTQIESATQRTGGDVVQVSALTSHGVETAFQSALDLVERPIQT